MHKIRAFALRNGKEILRDPLNLGPKKIDISLLEVVDSTENVEKLSLHITITNTPVKIVPGVFYPYNSLIIFILHIQHVFDKNPISSRRIVHQYVCHCPD